MGVNKKWIGMYVLKIRRNSNILEIGLGNGTKVNEILECYCPWRLLNKKGNTILLSSSDIFTPSRDTEWSDDFAWDVKGNNKFDEKIENGFLLDRIKVKNIKQKKIGDVKIIFSNGYKLEYFQAL